MGSSRVLGLHLIGAAAEMVNAVYVRKPSGYYLHVTSYLPKEMIARRPKLGDAVG